MIKRTQSIRIMSKCLVFFCIELINTANYLVNIIFIRTNIKTISEQKYLNIKPIVDHLCMFASLAYLYTPKKNIPSWKVKTPISNFWIMTMKTRLSMYSIQSQINSSLVTTSYSINYKSYLN